MSRQAWLTSDCGTLPPMPVYRVRRSSRDALRQQQTGIPVAPGQHVDDAHRVDRLEHPRIGGGTAAAAIRSTGSTPGRRRAGSPGRSRPGPACRGSMGIHRSACPSGRSGEQRRPRRSAGRSPRRHMPSTFWQISRVCSPGIGAGRSSRGRDASMKGAGPRLAGHRRVEQWMRHVGVAASGTHLRIGQHVDRPVHRSPRARPAPAAAQRPSSCPGARSTATPRR